MRNTHGTTHGSLRVAWGASQNQRNDEMYESSMAEELCLWRSQFAVTPELFSGDELFLLKSPQIYRCTLGQ